MAMSSLTPGVLFKSTGLNYMHTPSTTLTQPEQLRTTYRRSSINGETWPPDSPVAKIYDVRNSSSRLILLNNKMEKKSHLRVHSGHYKKASNGDFIGKIEPDRHSRSQSPPNPERHIQCLDSTSPRFKRPKTAPSPRAASSHHKSSCSLSASSRPQINDWHHYSSQPDRSLLIYSLPNYVKSKCRGERNVIRPPPSFRRNTEWLYHPDMTRGQKLYANSIAKVYDMTNMKQLKQAQYVQLIYREQQRGFFTPENYRKYLAYLNSERIMQFGCTGAPSVLHSTSKKHKESTPRRPHRELSHVDDEQSDIKSKHSAPRPTKSAGLPEKSVNKTTNNGSKSDSNRDISKGSYEKSSSSVTSNNQPDNNHLLMTKEKDLIKNGDEIRDRTVQ